MSPRFSSLRFLTAGVSKLAATRKPASNLLLLHTSATCKGPGGKKPANKKSAGKEPANKKPAGKEPANKKPADKEPANKKPAGKELVCIKPAKKKANIFAKPKGPFATDARKVAVVVSGCGDIDGSSILETTSLAVHLHRCGLAAELFGPDEETARFFDFRTRESYKNDETLWHKKNRIKVTRNTLSMAARLLVNHEVWPLEDLDYRRFKALVIPGGAGVGFILSNFLDAANTGIVNPNLKYKIEDFSKSKKPIGTISYAGILVAQVIPGVRLTIGRSDGDAGLPRDLIGLATAFGAEHVDKRADETCEDVERNVYSTPGLTVRTDPRPAIFDGIGKLVDAISRRIKERDGELEEAAPNPQASGSNQLQIKYK
ncbi:hypothetical protein TKK_0004760 [Trichogramma kaykai]|uniref:DJ-1/PfpI domain-containing protein n=1 Tax=Trichogramma kaykai TaxID=54128 RepID=A0ABD2XJK8_9HYME